MSRIILLFAFIFIKFSIFSQHIGGGFRFGSNFNRIYRPEDHKDIVQGWFSTLCIGPYFSYYSRSGGMEIGMNFIHKELKGQFSMPLVMRDLTNNETQNTALTSWEVDFRFGPRFGIVHPNTGYIVGSRFKKEGILIENDGTKTVNNIYMTLPIGCNIYFPTGFGNTGIGAHYHVGISNFIKNPDKGLEDWNGGRFQAISFEITVLFGNVND